MRVEPIAPSTRGAALEYLAHAPYLNVFISHVLLHDSAQARTRVAVATDASGIRGVVYSGRQLVIAADAEAIEPIAARVARERERMIVGPRETVHALWELIRAHRGEPRLIRDRQLVMAIDPNRLQPYEPRVPVRQAHIGEAAAVTNASAEMIRHELNYDPRRGSYDFAAGVRQMIDRGLWWVGVANGRLCFFCNVGPWCDRTAQLQGIWTPPELRGRGLATASLAAICERLFTASPTLSLYVNDFNAPAIALYRRVGFEHVGDFQTILF